MGTSYQIKYLLEDFKSGIRTDCLSNTDHRDQGSSYVALSYGKTISLLMNAGLSHVDSINYSLISSQPVIREILTILDLKIFKSFNRTAFSLLNQFKTTWSD